jgi:hypothetical protein
MTTERQAKTEATKREYRRVYDDMHTPRDIYAEHDGRTFVKRVWTEPGRFGWHTWTEV